MCVNISLLKKDSIYSIVNTQVSCIPNIKDDSTYIPIPTIRGILLTFINKMLQRLTYRKRSGVVGGAATTAPVRFYNNIQSVRVISGF